MSSSSDWRNVRVKEEPLSDYEGARESSRARGHSSGYQNQYGRSSSSGMERGGRHDGGKRDKRERYSPSPPPTHSESRGRRNIKASRFSRSRSRSPTRNRESDRDRNRDTKRERSRSRERLRESSHRDDRDRRPLTRDEEPERNRPNVVRSIKAEPQSRSPSINSRDRRREEHHSREDHGHSSRERQDGARERDWDNFFNPKSEMSKEAFGKRDKEERERRGDGDFGKNEEDSSEPSKEKEQPNFGLSGKLTEETNTFRGVVIKYSEPPEARKPNKIRWRLYPFKGEEALPVMYVHRQSAYLLGRDRKVADIPVDHPSCSKQHAVLQYRLVPYQRPDGSKGRRIKPYILDLESANGTYVNGNKIDPKRYVELFEKDVLKFGYSSREYVLLHDESKGIVDDASELTPD